ncbi:MAG TPA: ADP-ribosylglycohydrolase family protein [Actinocatenispora sp.]
MTGDAATVRVDRVRGAFVGLAIGDATGWPAARHRFGLLAPWTRRVARELDAFAEEHGVTTLPIPFALNQPTGPLAVGPSDDAEWLAYAASTVDDPPTDRYLRLMDRDDLRCRISVRTALDNLAAGLAPPASGHDNPHHFDDAAAVRAVAFGARYAGDPAGAAASAAADAEVTNALDGVSGARAVAAGVAVASTGDLAALPAAVLAELPSGTAIHRNTELALSVVDGRDPFEAAADLGEAVADHVYSYGVAAADTVPLAVALAVAAGGRIAAALGAAATLPLYADSVPALTGALCGAYAGFDALPTGWRDRCRTLAGCCLPEYAGTDLVAAADRLATRM